MDTTQKGPAYYILWLLGGVLKTVPVFFLEKVRLVFVATSRWTFRRCNLVVSDM